DPRILDELRKTAQEIREVMEQAGLLAQSFEKGRVQLVHLAGLGLMVEIVAHELNRATSNTLSTLADARERKGRIELSELIPSLEAQLKTLQKRLRVLDPMTTSGRQVKESFDVIEVVRDVMKGHAAQLRRHSIRAEVRVKPEEGDVLRIKMVRGMVVQVLENLIANSVYWLKQQRRYESGFNGTLTVTVDTEAKEIRVHDNGPGVDPERQEDIFEAFVTTKPPGEGKGLGLYISREIANYHGASLYMSDRRSPHKGRLNTFVFALEPQ
ncbi:MAG: HAMP domain-containing sensor histidine kinase, partial [Planctomycetota bacterium]